MTYSDGSWRSGRLACFGQSTAIAFVLALAGDSSAVARGIMPREATLAAVPAVDELRLEMAGGTYDVNVRGIDPRSSCSGRTMVSERRAQDVEAARRLLEGRLKVTLAAFSPDGTAEAFIQLDNGNDYATVAVERGIACRTASPDNPVTSSGPARPAPNAAANSVEKASAVAP